MLLDNGTIQVTCQRDDYHEVNKIEVCLSEEESNDEYASADEFFSLDEDMFSRDDSIMTDYVKEGVNVIVPCFGAPSHFEVEYHNKSTITPLVISLPGPVPYK